MDDTRILFKNTIEALLQIYLRPILIKLFIYRKRYIRLIRQNAIDDD